MAEEIHKRGIAVDLFREDGGSTRGPSFFSGCLLVNSIDGKYN